MGHFVVIKSSRIVIRMQWKYCYLCNHIFASDKAHLHLKNEGDLSYFYEEEQVKTTFDWITHANLYNLYMYV